VKDPAPNKQKRIRRRVTYSKEHQKSSVMASCRSIHILCRKYCPYQGSQNSWQVVLGTGRHPAGYASSVLYKPCCNTIVGPPIGRNETRVGTIARHSFRIGDFVEKTLLRASDGWRRFSTERTTQRIPTEIRLRKAEKVRTTQIRRG
jgi:hypothetical protein